MLRSARWSVGQPLQNDTSELEEHVNIGQGIVTENMAFPPNIKVVTVLIHILDSLQTKLN
jgi:hypothetical protein